MFKKLLPTLIIFIFTLSNTFAQKSIFGIYSNIEASEGEPSGFEMFFLENGNPGKCDVSVIFQASEGWPQYPELLDCCDFSSDHIEFVSKKWGKFIGEINNETLLGEFVDLKMKIVLKKGLSFWQRQ